MYISSVSSVIVYMNNCCILTVYCILRYRYGFTIYDLYMEFVSSEFVQVVGNIVKTLPKFYVWQELLLFICGIRDRIRLVIVCVASPGSSCQALSGDVTSIP